MANLRPVGGVSRQRRRRAVNVQYALVNLSEVFYQRTHRVGVGVSKIGRGDCANIGHRHINVGFNSLYPGGQSAMQLTLPDFAGKHFQHIGRIISCMGRHRFTERPEHRSHRYKSYPVVIRYREGGVGRRVSVEVRAGSTHHLGTGQAIACAAPDFRVGEVLKRRVIPAYQYRTKSARSAHVCRPGRQRIVRNWEGAHLAGNSGSQRGHIHHATGL